MKKLILFIHGLSGNSKSFGKFTQLIEDDEYMKQFDTASYIYPTIRLLNPYTWISLPKIQSLSSGLRSEIETKYCEYKEIILVCHSMGGLIAKKYLLDESENIKSFQNKVSKVIFYATPNIGSDFSKWFLSFNPQVRQLHKQSDFIEFLNKDQKRSDILKYIDFYYVVGTQDKVVDKASASAFWDDNYYEIEDKGHSINGVAKPKDKEDKTFLLLKKFVQENRELPNLTFDFLRSKNNQEIKNADKRYIINKEGFEELNMDVDISKYIQYLQNTNFFIKELKNRFFSIFNHKFLIPTLAKSLSFSEVYKSKNISLIEKYIEDLSFCKLDTVFDSINNIIKVLNTFRSSYKNKFQSTELSLNELEEQLFSIEYEFDKIEEFLNSKEFQLFLSSHLLITGEALIGKTHLLCHTASKYSKEKQPVILILGHTITHSNDLRKMILDKLDLSHLSFKNFLKEFQLLGEMNNCRSLLMIDAINEAGANINWYNQLVGLVEEINQYPNIRLVLTVRDVTKDSVIIEEVEKKFVLIEHKGFDGNEFEALKKLCNVFNMQLPTVPILHKINYNPGLLFLFFESLEKSGINYIDPDIVNPSTIFENIIKSINLKLAQELDFDKDAKLVDTGVSVIIDKFIEEEKNSLLYSNAYQVLKLSSLPYELKHLVSEGIFGTYINSDSEKEIFFSYQKLENYFISKYIIDKYIKVVDGNTTKETKEFLEQILTDYKHPWHNEMIIGALATLVPEKYNLELADLVDNHKNNSLIQNTFLDSFTWRKKSAFNKNTRNYLNELINSNTHHNYYHDSLEALLKLSMYPNHPYNANFLHEHLSKYTMAERDANWSYFLANYKNYTIIERIIDWSWFESNDFELDKESRRLYGIVLIWMLSANLRLIRDRATKALVSLFTNHLSVYLELMKLFEEVDDPYILERIYAVANGITFKSTLNSDSRELAIYIFNQQFKENRPYPHILLRDYARGVIEEVSKEFDLKIQLELIYPSYISEFEDSKISLDSLTQYKDKKGFKQIWWSLMYCNGGGISDFGHYIVSNKLKHWSNKKIGDFDIDRNKLLDEFIDSLNEVQQEKWNKRKLFYGLTLENILESLRENSKSEFEQGDIQNSDGVIELDYSEDGDIEIESFQINKEKEKKDFEESLSTKELEYFKSEIKPYLDENDLIEDLKDKFDCHFAERWIFKRIIEMGYDEVLHGELDLNMFPKNRNEHKVERIGKKYQWIAYHELLARVSDNYKLSRKNEDGNKKVYTGPWKPYIRDIDPTTILFSKNQNKIDWISCQYDFSNNSDSLSEWITRKDDIAILKNLVKIKIEKEPYLLLDGTFTFDETDLMDDNKPSRQIYYMVKSYLIKNENLEDFYLIGKEKNFFGRWMPEQSNLYEVNLREFSNSYAFKEFDKPYYSRLNWSDVEEIPHLIASTSDSYLNESSGHDCSIETSFSISLPSNILINTLGLEHDKSIDGCFSLKDNKKLVFDPSVIYGGEDCLIADSTILDLLKKKGYSIFWTLIGEKNIINCPSEIKKDRLVFSGLGYFDKKFIESRNHYME